MDDDTNYEPKNGYQDDLDTNSTDPLVDEETDDPTEGFGVPPEKFKEELDRLDGEAPAAKNPEYDGEDAREQVEDLNDDNDRD